MTTYLCPRTDLDCAATFTSPGDLDWHFRMTHGYSRLYSLWTSLRPPQPLGPPPERHVPDGLVEGPGTRTLAEQRADQRADQATRHPERLDDPDLPALGARTGGTRHTGGTGHTGELSHTGGLGRTGETGHTGETGRGAADDSMLDSAALAGLRPSATRGAAATRHRRSKRHARSSH
ncbi:hypothetical protein [Frankia sp. R82]|uniref:hypothetical protein n=1 Tax=Frankia sp. R82 TaxID=2950553 RepID=UPI002044C09C|nr:hypothetical protein [Frankia sp. R82]MCM3882976.1 hypothetical protein [Frankia sp. R82]